MFLRKSKLCVYEFLDILTKEELFATVALLLLFGIQTVSFCAREITRKLLHVLRASH